MRKNIKNILVDIWILFFYHICVQVEEYCFQNKCCHEDEGKAVVEV